MISIFQDGNSQTVAFETTELLGDDHCRFEISLTTKTPEGETVDPSMDDASDVNVKALQDKARQLIDTECNRIQALAKTLAQPKASVRPMGYLPEKGILLKPENRGGPAA